jgi:putative phosphoribosyl transferase
MLSLSHGQFDRLAERERVELERRVRDYRGDRALPDLRDRDVVVVDDGLATGLTAEAALCSLRFHRPRRIILAVPVCSAAAVRRLAAVADEVVRLSQPASFIAVGQWYDDFSQTTDADVRRLVQAASHATETQP